MTKRNITVAGIVLILLAAAGITIIGSLSNKTPKSVGTLQSRPLTVNKFDLQQASLVLPLLDESSSKLAYKPEFGQKLQLKGTLKSQLKNTLKLGQRLELKSKLKFDLKSKLKSELTAGLKLDRKVDARLGLNSLMASLSQRKSRLDLAVLLKGLDSPSGLCDNFRGLLNA